MVQLTREQIIFVVLHYTKTQSIAAAQNAFHERFPDRNRPCITTILPNFQKYSNPQTSLNLNKGNPGRRRIGAIRALLQENPHVSERQNPIDISSSSFNRITKFELPAGTHTRCTCDTSCSQPICTDDYTLRNGSLSAVVDVKIDSRRRGSVCN